MLSWGIIGCGDVTEVKSGPAFNKIAGSELVAVMRRNGALAKDYAVRHGVPKWYDDADMLIGDPDVQAIYIATPPDSHCDYTLRAAAAGKPVYVEKPMARTYRECLEMIDACEKADVALFVAYYRRCLPNFLKVKSLVDEGAIGEIRLVNVLLHKAMRDDPPPPEGSNWRIVPEVAGGGHFYDLASHQFDYLDFLLGSIENASGLAGNQAGRYDAEDVVTASWRHAAGVLGSGSWCFTVDDSSDRDQTEIIGSEGKISFSFFNDTPIRLETRSGAQSFPIPYPRHVQQPLIETVVDALLGRGPCPSTGTTAARTNHVLESIVES
jgi:predicted dehydrogenase